MLFLYYCTRTLLRGSLGHAASPHIMLIAPHNLTNSVSTALSFYDMQSNVSSCLHENLFLPPPPLQKISPCLPKINVAGNVPTVVRYSPTLEAIPRLLYAPLSLEKRRRWRRDAYDTLDVDVLPYVLRWFDDGSVITRLICRWKRTPHYTSSEWDPHSIVVSPRGCTSIYTFYYSCAVQHGY